MQRVGPAISEHCRNAVTPTVREDAAGRRILFIGDKTILLYQVHYDNASANKADPLCTPLRNPHLGPFFESALIAALLAEGHHTTADYLGVLSWQFRAKIPLPVADIVLRMQRDAFAADVYTFFGRIRDRHPWRLAETKHPGITRAAQVLLQRLGIDADLAGLQAPIVHHNHFICRSLLYERFVTELLAPALQAMRNEADHQLQELLRQDAHYHDPRLPPARLRAIFGTPHFCLHPFLCERLFSTWLAFNPAVRVRHIWRGRFVAATNVRHEPEMKRALLPS